MDFVDWLVGLTRLLDDGWGDGDEEGFEGCLTRSGCEERMDSLKQSCLIAYSWYRLHLQEWIYMAPPESWRFFCLSDGCGTAILTNVDRTRAA